MSLAPQTPRRHASASLRRNAVAVLVAAGAALQPLTAWAGPAGAFYDRSFVLAADARCGLFKPELAAALKAASLQARGAAARAGVPEAELAQTAARARDRAAGVDCAHPDLVVVRDRVGHAFAGWAATPRMSFPGQRADWSADRYAAKGVQWRFRQSTTLGQAALTLGQTSEGGGLKAVVSFVGAPRPYAARIVMRDVGRSAQPWLGGPGVADLPPESVRRAIFATASRSADAELLAKGRKAGDVWTFPLSAADDLARLDPRETVRIEFLFRDDSTAAALIEIGDLAAAQAFVAMGEV